MSYLQPDNPTNSYVASGISRIRDLAPATILNNILHDADDDEIEHVEHFKYKQDLDRKLTVSSIIGLGFTLMGIPFGLSSTLWILLVDGGNVTMLYGWLIVGFFSICIVLSLCEIIAKFPTAGGVYHFSAILSNEKYSLVSSWFTGWFLLIGNWTYAVSIMFLGSQFILSIFGLKNVYYKEDIMLVLGVYFILLSFVGFVNFKFSRYLEYINRVCIIWSIGSVLLIGTFLMLFAKRKNSIGHILTDFDNTRSGWPDPLAFMIGLQSSSFTLTGYGMLFSMTDEVKNPERNMPKGAISAVVMCVIQGLFFILSILVILPELSVVLDTNPEIMPIDIVFKSATQSYIVSFLLILLLVGTVIFQAIGGLTTASRSTYAFARDGGLPFKNLWVEVGSVEDSVLPKNALFLSMGVCGAFSLLALISPSAFAAFMGASVISLALANGIPIFCLMLNKRRKIKGSAFRLRYFGWLINGISVIWVFLSFFILCLPPVIKNLTWQTMNYASVVFVVLVLTAAVGYKTWGANVFTGPPIDTDYLELHNLEANSRLDNFVVGEEEDTHSTTKNGYQGVSGEQEEGERLEVEEVSTMEATLSKSTDIELEVTDKEVTVKEVFCHKEDEVKQDGTDNELNGGNEFEEIKDSGIPKDDSSVQTDDDLNNDLDNDLNDDLDDDGWDNSDDFDDFEAIDDFDDITEMGTIDKGELSKATAAFKHTAFLPNQSIDVIFDQDDN
ncbi:CIC11C00000003966 [Sungouiella intermedia]|uniref:CIC11C00000003966 n=1 Tax=Sungouiella intermedia TaxID=45354 RepID=A0A1L0DCY0_9ASCO|nr:CIC11C00000003966 [[Candida] intermedia]